MGEAYQGLAGFVPEETERLMLQGETVFLNGAMETSDGVRLQEVDALEGMARYFRDAWAFADAEKFLGYADQKLRDVGLGGILKQRLRLSAGLKEINADLLADNKGDYVHAVQQYEAALLDFGTDPASQLDRARIERKIATAYMALGNSSAADSHLSRALLLYSNDAPTERANLDDVFATRLAQQGKSADAIEMLQNAVAIENNALSNERTNDQPSRALAVSLATHLQHLGDALRQAGLGSAASSSYDKAEQLATEVLKTYPNQLSVRFLRDVVRHGNVLLVKNGQVSADRVRRLAAIDAAVDQAFAAGVGRFKFGTSPAEVNTLAGSSLTNQQLSGLPRAYEYTTGEVRYFWMPLANFAEFRDFYENTSCLVSHNPYPNDLPDYVVFMFHENALMRISVRLYGNARAGCPDRRELFQRLAAQYQMPLFGTHKQWRIDWETRRSHVVGTTSNEGPMLDIVAR
jgi:tetratricopeptide (TPR) repeat protein